jgi:AbrB family looped-hinge helix DNA binding protein
MNITKLSSKGQVIIPKNFRQSHRWDAGLELVVIDMGDGILLKPKTLFKTTHLDEVAGCLSYKGPPKSQDDIDRALEQAAKKAWRGRD